MRFLPRALVACGTGFAVSLLAACGSTSGLLSGDQANSLQGALNQVGSAVNAGDCGAAANASQSFNSAVSNLPGGVNSTLRANLTQAGATVAQLASRQCHTTSSTTTPTTSSTATTSSTQTTTTTPTTTTTTPTTTTTTPTTTTETTPTTTGTTPTSPSGGGGLSGGGGSGGGGNGAGGLPGGNGNGNNG